MKFFSDQHELLFLFFSTLDQNPALGVLTGLYTVIHLIKYYIYQQFIRSTGAFSHRPFLGSTRSAELLRPHTNPTIKPNGFAVQIRVFHYLFAKQRKFRW